MSEFATMQPGDTRTPDGRAQITGPCPNCGDPTESPYCPNCGQRRVQRRVSLRRMLLEVIEDQFALNATLPRTVGCLLFRPGFLSQEYIAGRIQRYIPPFRLYLAASVVFFLLLTFYMRGMQLEGKADLAIARDSMNAALAQMDSTERAEFERARHRGVFLSLGGTDSTDSRDSTGADSAAVAADSAGPYLWGDNIEIRTFSAALDTLVIRRLNELRKLPPERAADAFMKEAVQRLPTAVFLLLPVFAALLKLLYIRRSRYYVEHFVFGLHTHAFTFLLFTIMLVGDTRWLRLPALLWMVVYYYLAMKRFYGQGAVKTFLKYLIVLQAYTMIISFGIMGLLVVALLLA